MGIDGLFNFGHPTEHVVVYDGFNSIFLTSKYIQQNFMFLLALGSEKNLSL